MNKENKVPSNLEIFKVYKITIFIFKAQYTVSSVRRVSKLI